MEKKENILVTGAAGFIGFHLVERLINEGYSVFGVDVINDYYDIELKYSRLLQSGIKRELLQDNNWVKSSKTERYQFIKLDLANRIQTESLFKENVFDKVVHLAAQPGVRYSLENPHAYIESNIVAFLNILEGCRQNNINKLFYASSSSIYGQNSKIPFAESDRVDKPISLYAATKKSNELMAYTYAHLYGIQTIGLRFFTVYGPWGRPDMAPFLFAKAAVNNETIKVFNYGNQSRDFTYIDDIINGLNGLLDVELSCEPKAEVYNIGQGNPMALMDFIQALETSLGVVLEKKLVEAQPGDVEQTYADVSLLIKKTGYNSKVSVVDGVERFISWYKGYDQNE